MTTTFEEILLASGFAKKKEMLRKPIFGSVEVAFMESDGNDPDDSFDTEWLFYLNDQPFSETMECVFEKDGDYFNAYMSRKLRKDKSGNLGFILTTIYQDGDGAFFINTGRTNEISIMKILDTLSNLEDYPSLINHMLGSSGLGTFFSFTEGYYVYLYLCHKAGWSAEKTHKTLQNKINVAPFLAEYMSKKNFEMIDKSFVQRFFSHVQ